MTHGIRTMLGVLAVGAASTLATPASAGGITYLSDDCNNPDVAVGCPILPNATPIGELRAERGVPLEVFLAINPKLPAGADDNYMVPRLTGYVPSPLRLAGTPVYALRYSDE